MRRTTVIALLLSFLPLLMGACQTNYYKVYDPDTGRTYYTKGWLAEAPGVKSNRKVELVTQEEYERAVRAIENR